MHAKPTAYLVLHYRLVSSPLFAASYGSRLENVEFKPERFDMGICLQTTGSVPSVPNALTTPGTTMGTNCQAKTVHTRLAVT